MSNFWKKFDDLMDSVPKYIDDTIKKAEKQAGVAGSNYSSVSTYMSGKDTVIIKTVNGKTKVTVNGKEYVEKSSKKA